VGRKRKEAGGKKEKSGPRAGKRNRGGGGLLGWAERRGREMVWKVFFFLNLFKLTFQTFEIELFSKTLQDFQNIFKSF
jgi:hypothetical protein